MELKSRKTELVEKELGEIKKNMLKEK